MTERAEVVAVRGLRVTVRSGPTETCGSCASPLCAPRVRTYEATVDGGLADGVVPGARVEIGPSGSGLGKGLLLFVMPLTLFVAGYLGPGGGASEAVRAAAGFVGLAAGLLIAVAVGKVWKEAAPRVIRICEPVTTRDSRTPTETTPPPGI